MRLDGIHHVTCITGDAPENVDFYARVLGLRLVKKSVNQDDPTVYHLFYADEKGSAGADITFFEYPGAARGRAGAGFVHTVVWRVGVGRGARLLGRRGSASSVERRAHVDVRDPEGLAARARRLPRARRAAVADHPEIPRELALQGFEGVRAYARDPELRTAPFLEQLGFEREGERAGRRAATRAAGGSSTRPRRTSRASPAPGTVHHVAWASTMDEHEAWRARVAEAGGRPTESSTASGSARSTSASRAACSSRSRRSGPGFATDEDPAHLGETLILPPEFEHLRAQVEPILTPLPNPRESWSANVTPARPRAPRGRGAGGRARPPPRPRRRRARPLPAARRARPGAPAAGLHAARTAGAAAGRRALVRGAARRLSRPGDVRDGYGALTDWFDALPFPAERSCSAASRRARS